MFLAKKWASRNPPTSSNKKKILAERWNQLKRMNSFFLILSQNLIIIAFMLFAFEIFSN